MFELATRGGPHQWKMYDEKHRACLRCGLRLFWTEGAYGSRGWVLVTGDGVMISRVLGQEADGGFGRCERPSNTSVELCVIEYTGDPDRHPGCERFMHLVAGIELQEGRSRPGLVTLDACAPACGWQPMFWEIGPARRHEGWTLCGECFPGKGPTAAECAPGRRRHAKEWTPPEHQRPGGGRRPAQLPPAPKQLPKKKTRLLPP